MDSLVHAVEGEERGRQAGRQARRACSCSQTRNVTCSWSACNWKFVRRRREAVERGGAFDGGAGSAGNRACQRWPAQRRASFATVPSRCTCTPLRDARHGGHPWLVFHPRVPSRRGFGTSPRDENARPAFTWPARNLPVYSPIRADNLCLWPS